MFTRFFNRIKSWFIKPKKTAETIGFMGEVEHHEGGYYTIPVFIENENFEGFTPIESINLNKDV